jgi:hypothetical protein
MSGSGLLGHKYGSLKSKDLMKEVFGVWNLDWLDPGGNSSFRLSKVSQVKASNTKNKIHGCYRGAAGDLDKL